MATGARVERESATECGFNYARWSSDTCPEPHTARATHCRCGAGGCGAPAPGGVKRKEQKRWSCAQPSEPARAQALYEGSSGRSTRTTVPEPGEDSRASEPPASSARSFIPIRPKWLLAMKS